MPSTHDDSAGSSAFSSPRSTPPENAGNQGRSEIIPDRWLGNYMTARMVAAGIDAAVARQVANEMQPDIVGAFATLTRLDPRGNYL